MLNTEEARKLLMTLGYLYVDEDDEIEKTEVYNKLKNYLNMNDVWCWACAEGEYVPDEELPVVADLFCNYGWCGILYWVSQRNNCMRSEFYDNNRFIEFVENEERIKKEVPDYNKRAYHQTSYTIKGERKVC